MRELLPHYPNTVDHRDRCGGDCVGGAVVEVVSPHPLIDGASRRVLLPCPQKLTY